MTNQYPGTYATEQTVTSSGGRRSSRECGFHNGRCTVAIQSTLCLTSPNYYFVHALCLQMV